MNSSSSIRVAVVEDTPHDREWLVNLLNGTPGFMCAAICASGEEAVAKLPSVPTDVVLMDIELPGLSGIECVRVLSPRMLNCQFMMLTIFEDYERIFESIRAGAKGYLLKKTDGEEVLRAVRSLHEGRAMMSGQLARLVAQNFQDPSGLSHPEVRLSPAEDKVLRRLARGLLYKEVADEMGITMSTVRTHIWHIYSKLQVHNRTDAVNKAYGQRRMGGEGG